MPQRHACVHQVFHSTLLGSFFRVMHIFLSVCPRNNPQTDHSPTKNCTLRRESTQHFLSHKMMYNTRHVGYITIIRIRVYMRLFKYICGALLLLELTYVPARLCKSSSATSGYSPYGLKRQYLSRYVCTYPPCRIRELIFIVERTNFYNLKSQPATFLPRCVQTYVCSDLK